jgi:hypothetical protein
LPKKTSQFCSKKIIFLAKSAFFSGKTGELNMVILFYPFMTQHKNPLYKKLATLAL